jgi:pyrroloquinoline quinone biosynthesis protein A
MGEPQICLYHGNHVSEIVGVIIITFEDKTMWTKPEYSDMRFGFEVTMYICNR